MKKRTYIKVKGRSNEGKKGNGTHFTRKENKDIIIVQIFHTT